MEKPTFHSKVRKGPWTRIFTVFVSFRKLIHNFEVKKKNGEFLSPWSGYQPGAVKSGILCKNRNRKIAMSFFASLTSCEKTFRNDFDVFFRTFWPLLALLTRVFVNFETRLKSRLSFLPPDKKSPNARREGVEKKTLGTYWYKLTRAKLHQRPRKFVSHAMISHSREVVDPT